MSHGMPFGAARPLVLSSTTRVWLLNAALAGVAFAVWTNVTLSGDRATLPWWAFALAYAFVEVAVVHVHLRRDAYSFSLAEVPLVIGLVFAAPAALLVGQLLGSTIALVAIRRQAPLKVAFNVANFAVSTTVAILIYDVLRAGDPYAPGGWPALFGAVLGAAIVNVVLIGLVMRIAEGRSELGKFLEVNGFGLVVALTNTAFALSAMIVFDREPAATALLAMMGAVLFIAYRAYAAERRHHEGLEFIYSSTRALAGNRELGEAVVMLLDNSCAAFRSTVAELYLLVDEAKDRAAHTRVAPGEEPIVMRSIPGAPTDPWWHFLLRAGEPVLLHRSDGDAHTDALLDHIGTDNAMVVRLDGEAGHVGLLVVGGRNTGVTPYSPADLRLFATVASHAAVSLENDHLETSVAKLLELERQLSHQAFHDAMTGLANRRRFRSRLEDVIGDRRAAGAVLFVDLDDFKTVNDTLGHAVGDEVLRVVANRLRDTLRADDMIARLGGDEFAVLVAPDGRNIDVVAGRVVDAIRQPVIAAGQRIRVGCSIGIALTEDAETADELIRNADTAMYEAKARGKGRFARFTADLYASVHARHVMQTQIDQAIENDEFDVHFQPIVDLATGQLMGAEALVRWCAADGSIIPAGAFIDFAEETGQSVAIGRFVIAKAIEAGTRLVEACGPDFCLTINVSGRQLAETDVAADVIGALDRSGLPPRNLVIEITETAVMTDLDDNIERLGVLRDVGVRLALDDFGTGYSSLSHLREFPIDLLKVAKPFVDDIGTSEQHAVFLRVIVELGHALGMAVVAEGVETVEQAHALQVLDCEYAQGYLYARPADAETFLASDLARQAAAVAGSAH